MTESIFCQLTNFASFYMPGISKRDESIVFCSSRLTRTRLFLQILMLICQLNIHCASWLQVSKTIHKLHLWKSSKQDEIFANNYGRILAKNTCVKSISFKDFYVILKQGCLPFCHESFWISFCDFFQRFLQKHIQELLQRSLLSRISGLLCFTTIIPRITFFQ